MSVQIQTIEQEWQEFSKIYFRGEDMPHEVTIEAKKVFYAGYTVCMKMIFQATSEDVTEDESSKLLRDIRSEVNDFAFSLVGGIRV